MAIAISCCGFHNSGILVNPQDIAPKHAGSVFGIMNMAGAIPGFVGVYIAGHILEATKSWSAVFNQTAGGCSILWMLGLRYFLIKKHRLNNINVRLDEGPNPNKIRGQPAVPWVTLFTKPAFWSLIVGHFCENNAFYILLSWLPTYFHENFPHAK
ncbi:hypothetical protein LOTGIDRAFT_176626, partial [Lottia gigantea]